jgi:hypothetical protein
MATPGESGYGRHGRDARATVNPGRGGKPASEGVRVEQPTRIDPSLGGRPAARQSFAAIAVSPLAAVVFIEQLPVAGCQLLVQSLRSMIVRIGPEFVEFLQDHRVRFVRGVQGSVLSLGNDEFLCDLRAQFPGVWLLHAISIQGSGFSN